MRDKLGSGGSFLIGLGAVLRGSSPSQSGESAVLASPATLDRSIFIAADGRTYAIGRDGRPTTDAVEGWDCETEGCVVGLHGMMFDNFDAYYFNPHNTMYASLARTFAGREFRGIGWQSVALTWPDLKRAWAAGHTTWYGLAIANARLLAPHLARLLGGMTKPFDLVCHSLGCSLALQAIAHDPPPQLRRILLLNGALDKEADAGLLDGLRGYTSYNVVVEDDGLLRIAAMLGRIRPSRLIGLSEVRLDAASGANVVLDVKPIGARVSFDMSNPNRLFDHLFSFEASGACEVLRELSDAPRVIRTPADLPPRLREFVARIVPFDEAP